MRIISAAVLFIVAMVLAACGGAAPAAPPASAAPRGTPAAASAAPGLQTIVEGARKEGQLTLSWAAETMGTESDFGKLTAGFKSAYGLDSLNVAFTPGPSMPQMAAKVAQEVQAGHPTSSDIVLGEALHMLTLSNAGAIAPIDWASWAPAVRDPALMGANGAAIPFELLFPGITYNTNQLKGDAIPKSMADLLNPRYTGHLASTVYAAHFDELTTAELWGPSKTSEYVARFAKQINGLIACGEIGRIASGEFDALALDCGTSYQSWMARGAPVAHVIPSDAAFSYPLYMAVPKTAAHPHAAELFINYVLSRPGQDVLFKATGSDNPLVPGSRTAAELDGIKAATAKPVTADIAFWQRNDEKQTSQLKAQLLKTLQGKGA